MKRTSMNPKVSIIIPVYNGSNYLKEAIDSALAQTYKNIEIIVVNDGSNDNGATDKIAKSYGKKIKYYRKENGGVATALNLGIEKMTGEYFSWLSHDDLYYPDKIEKQINFLDKLKNKKVVLYSNYEVINEDSQHVSYVKQDHSMMKIKPEYALLRGCVNGITLLIPKEAFVYAGSFDAELKCTQDYDMWRRIIRKYDFVHMEVFLSKTRVHPRQDSNSHPRAITEGDELWINMMKGLSRSTKKRLEGSEYNFFINMYHHLEKTQYCGAANYAKKRADDIYNKLGADLSVSKPMISVIIPCFNQGKYINDAVSSVLEQTYDNFEIIIINDGSSDKYTNNILKKYNRPKTVVYKTTNKGVTLARSLGVSVAKGEYIQFLDADDYISPEKFEQQIRIFKVNPSLQVCYTGYHYYFEDSMENIPPELSQVVSNNPLEDFVYRWQRSLSIPIHSALFRSDIFKKSSPLAAGIRGAEDWIMWVDMASRGAKFFLLNDDMATYRVQSTSISKNSTHMFYWSCRAVSYIAEKYIDRRDIERYDRNQESYLIYLANILLFGNISTQINELKEINNRLLCERQDIYNSHSWKITKLPRAMKRLFVEVGSYGPFLFARKAIVKFCKKIISCLE